MILLETDVVVDLLREYAPVVARFDSLDADEEIVLPGFVAMELVYGSASKAEQEELARTIRGSAITWPLPETCDEALSTLARYRLSHGLGIMDALVGQTALALDLPLHTSNQKHCSAIPDLRTVQPYPKS